MNHINATGVITIKMQALYVTARTEMGTNTKFIPMIQSTILQLAI